MAFESLKQAAPSVDLMLVRYEERAQKGLVERTEMDRSFALVEKALRSVKGRLQDPQFLQSLNADEIKKLSNAWTAWGNEKFIPDAALRRELASVLIEDKANPRRDRALTYARQIWRTEMSATVVRDLTKDASRTDAEKSTVLKKIMEGQIVKELEDSPVEALRVSMHLDGALNSMAVRQQLATEMEASQINGLGAWGPLDQMLAQQGKSVERFRVGVGGDLLEIPANMRESLKLKHVIIRENRCYAQMENGCRGNLVIIDLHSGDGEESQEDGTEVLPDPEELNLYIQQMLPEFADYLRVNPQTHWFDFSDVFFTLPLAKRREIESQIKLKLTREMDEAMRTGIDAKIRSATDPQKRALFEATKDLMSGAAGMTIGRSKLKMAGPEGAVVLADMNHKLERVRQGQLLTMFEAYESSKHEGIVDDWAAYKYFTDADENSQKRMDTIRKVSPVVQEIYMNPANAAALKTVDETLVKIKMDPSLLPSHITTADLTEFEKYWNEYKAGPGAGLLGVNVNDDDFVDKMSAESQKEWLDLAKQMKEEGQYEQAEQILRKILTGHQKTPSEPDTLENMVDKGLTVDEKTDIQAEINDEVKDDLIIRSLEEQGLMNQAGFEMFGLYVAGDYIDPHSGAVITEPQARDILVQEVRKTTVDSLSQKAYLKKAASKDLLDSVAWTALEKDAWDVYQDLEGTEWGTVSDENEDFILEEIGLNVALLAASAAGVGLIGLGARATAYMGRAATVVRWSNSASRATRLGAVVVRNAPGIVADGTLFHVFHSALSAPRVGLDQATDNLLDLNALAHSVALYGVFGAGNAAWNAGMRGVSTRYAGATGVRGALGRAAEASQVRSIRDAYRMSGPGVRATAREVGGVVLAKQPAMFLEANAMTAMTGLEGYEDGNYADNLFKNWVTLNLLWGMPNVNGPREFSPESLAKVPSATKGGKRLDDLPMDNKVSPVTKMEKQLSGNVDNKVGQKVTHSVPEGSIKTGKQIEMDPLTVNNKNLESSKMDGKSIDGQLNNKGDISLLKEGKLLDGQTDNKLAYEKDFPPSVQKPEPERVAPPRPEKPERAANSSTKEDPLKWPEFNQTGERAETPPVAQPLNRTQKSNDDMSNGPREYSSTKVNAKPDYQYNKEVSGQGGNKSDLNARQTNLEITQDQVKKIQEAKTGGTNVKNDGREGAPRSSSSPRPEEGVNL